MNNNHQINRFSNNRFRHKVYPFFWFIAAADENLLQRCPVPEQDKQAGIGMAILCTTIAAMISSYYAIHSLFDQWTIAFPLAFFWAVIIFNLDRFMVGSMRKDKQKNWLKELYVAIPRIVLAFLIAILISKPLEVKVFQNQIEAEELNFNNKKVTKVLGNQLDDLSGKKKDLDNAIIDYKDYEAKKENYEADPEYKLAKDNYNDCLKDQARLERRLELTRQRRRELYNNLRVEERINGNNQIQALNRQIKELNAQIKALGCRAKDMIMKTKANEYISRQNILIENARNRKDSMDKALRGDKLIVAKLKDSEFEKYSKAGNDILGQLRILDSLKNNDRSMLLASWLITALFFILELAPIMVKILSPRGEYDALIATAEQQAFDREEAAEEESKQEKNARKKAASQNAMQVGELDDMVKQKVQERILNAHADLAGKIVEAWRKQEEADLNSNTQEYLKNKITQTS